MLELAMAAARRDQSPAILVKKPEDLADFHRHKRSVKPRLALRAPHVMPGGRPLGEFRQRIGTR